MWSRVWTRSKTTKSGQPAYLALILSVLVGSYGCGSGKGTVSVTISPTTATVRLGQTEQFSAAVTGNTNTSVTWSVNNVTGGNSSVGTVSTQGLYTAPLNAVNASSVSVTATSVADTSKSSSATVTVSSGAVVTVLPTSGATVAVGDCYQFSDTVTNLSTTTEPTAVEWYVDTVAGGNTTAGSISTTGYYCAPSEVGSTTTHVIKAVLKADTTSYGSTNVTVLPSGAPTLSSTEYSPSTLAQGAYFEDLYLSGNNFLSTSQVRVDGTPVPTTFISSSVISARVSGSYLVPPTPGSNGTLFVDVLQESGTTSNVVEITTVPTAPALIGITPNSIPYTSTQGGTISVALDGGYYTSQTTSAEFNGQSTALTAPNTRQLNLTITTPSQLGVTTGGLYPLNVRNAGQTGKIAATNLAVGSGTSPTVLTTYGVGSSPNSVAVDTALGIALVANTGSNTISAFSLGAFFVSPQGNPQLATTTVGKSPTCVAIDNLHHLGFVVNNGDDTIQILDLTTLTATAPAKIITTITNTTSTPVYEYPYSISVNGLTGQALVVYQNSNVTTFINYEGTASPQSPTVATDETRSQISQTGSNPLMAIEPKLNWALVTPGGNGSLAFVDLNGNGNEIVAAIAAPSSNGATRSSGTTTITTEGTHGLSVNDTVVVAGVNDASFDGTFAVASVPSSTTFTYSQTGKPDTSSSNPVGNGTVSAAAPLVTLGVDINVRGIAVNPQTEQALFTDPSSTSLSILSLLDQSVITISTSTTGYSAAAINPLTNIAVAVNSNGNAATLVDLQSQQILTQFSVGNNPVAVAIDPTTDIAMVVNQNDGTVTFIQLGTIRSTLPTPQPQIVDISPFSTLTSSSGSTITVIGAGFTGNSVVRLGETPLTTTSISSRELTAAIPASMLGSANRYALDVLNADGTVSNVKDFTVMQAVKVGTAPQGVAIDRQRDLAVVSNTGSNTVTIFKLSDLSILGTLNVGRSPTGVAVSSIFGRAAVTNNEDNTVSVIDLDNIAVNATVAVASSSSSGTTSSSRPLGLAIHPGTGNTVVADSNAAQISFFNIASPGTPTTLALDAGPSAVAIDPTRNIAAVAEAAANEVAIVDLGSSQVLDRETGFQLPTGAIYDPDSDTFLIISSLGNSFLSVTARPATGSYVTSAPYKVGINPTAIDYNYNSSTLVTSNTSSNTLSVMDFLTKTVKAVIPLSVSQQFGVAIDRVRNTALVVDQANGRVLIVPLPR
jgi:DNA-binding beta-propeller fold protein YncE